MTSPVGEAVREAAVRLRVAGSPSPRLDAEVLAAHALGRDRSWVLAHPEAVLEASIADAFEAALARRETGEPIAYIRGFKEWLSLRIEVDSSVLIPRPETEMLAEAAIQALGRYLTERPPGQQVVAWDVGTGSGALAVAIGLAYRDALAAGRLRLVASDASTDALSAAARNLAAHDLQHRVELVEADLVDGDPTASVDMLVANLPYVPSSEIAGLPVAASFEPRDALDGGPDGLDLVRRLVDRLPAALTTDGVALLEIGAGQADAVRRHAEPGGLVAEVARRDLAGIDRVVAIRRAST